MNDRKYHVFLSYNAANATEAGEIYDYLSNSGFRVFFDKECLTTGGTWQREIEHALESSDSILVLIGPNGIGPWQETENYGFQIISVRSQPGRSIIPAFLPRAQEPDDYPAFLRQYHRFEFDTSVKNELSVLMEKLPKGSDIGEFERPLLDREQDALLRDTVRAYDKMAVKYYEKWKNIIPPSIHAFLFELEKTTPAGRILDAGCGPGHHANFLADRGHRVSGVDLSPEFIKIAKQNSHPNCDFRQGDMRNLQRMFEDRNLFDGIWACASCLHLTKETLYSQLFQFSAILKPNAILGVSFQVGMPRALMSLAGFLKGLRRRSLVK